MLTISNCIDDLRQDFETAHCSIYLSTSMVRNDNAFTADFESFLCIGRALDAFHDKRATS